MNQVIDKSSAFATALIVSLSLFASGCGGGGAGPDTRPDRVAFGGVAKLNGSAVVDGLITFHPVAADGNGASGKTDSSGNFVMSTFEASDGVVPGEYTVTVIKVIAPAADTQVSDEDEAYDGGPTEDSAPVETNALPPKFEKTETSGVKVTVTEADTEFLLEFK